jgi:hypothetical protein
MRVTREHCITSRCDGFVASPGEFARVKWEASKEEVSVLHESSRICLSNDDGGFLHRKGGWPRKHHRFHHVPSPSPTASDLDSTDFFPFTAPPPPLTLLARYVFTCYVLLQASPRRGKRERVLPSSPDDV